MRILASIFTGIFAVAMTVLGVITLLLLAIVMSNFTFTNLAHLGILIFTLVTGLAAVLALPCFLFVGSPRREIYVFSILPLWLLMDYVYSLPAARGLIH